MKKILMLGTLAAIFTATSFAQTAATVNLSVHIADIHTIEVSDPNVTIGINDATDLLNASTTTGVSKVVPAHLKVVSNSGFRVFATTTTPLVNSSTSDLISQDRINIAITAQNPVNPNATNQLQGWTATPVHNLGTQPTIALIETNASGGGTTGTQFDVTYKLSEVTDIASKPSGTYTTLVTYTLTGL